MQKSTPVFPASSASPAAASTASNPSQPHNGHHESVHVISNPVGGVSGPLAGNNSLGSVTFTTPPVVPVDPALLASNGLKLIVEAPPVTELVTETPLESGLSSSTLGGVIGGKPFFILS